MAAKSAGRDAPSKRKPSGTKRRPTVSIIGAGRLGTALARALSDCGYEIEAFVARRITHARRAAKLSGTKALSLTAKQLSRLPASDLLFITTPDDAIAETAAQLRATLCEQQRRRTAFHASGALSSEALNGLRDAGFAVASLHPLVSVSDSVQGALSLRTAFYCVEGDRAARHVAVKVVRDLGGQSFSINQRDKALYHAAAVMSSGHLVALFDIAADMLARCGLNERRARAVLLPLLRSTIENLATQQPAQALTGTFARADMATMRRHLAAIRSQTDDETLAAYVLLGQRSLKLAAKSDADEIELEEMSRLLTSNYQASIGNHERETN